MANEKVHTDMWRENMNAFRKISTNYKVLITCIVLLVLYFGVASLNTVVNQEVTPEPTEINVEHFTVTESATEEAEQDFYEFYLPKASSEEVRINEAWVDVRAYDHGNNRDRDIYALHETVVIDGDEAYVMYHLFRNRELVLQEYVMSVVGFNQNYALLHDLNNHLFLRFEFETGESEVLIYGVSHVYDAALDEENNIVVAFDSTVNGEYANTFTMLIEGETFTEVPIQVENKGIVSFEDNILILTDGKAYEIGDESVEVEINMTFPAGLATVMEYRFIETSYATYSAGWGTVTVNGDETDGYFLSQIFGDDLVGYLDISRFAYRDGGEVYRGNHSAIINGGRLVAITPYTLNIIDVRRSMETKTVTYERYLRVSIYR